MNLISELLTLVARVVRAALFLLLFLALLLVGLVVFGVLLVWSLLRGRPLQRPTMGVFRTASDFRAQAFKRQAEPMGEVVDVEVREVPQQPHQPQPPQQQPRLDR
ncbi:hypothetical protein SAMN05216359_101531 [Roseateles sp. YR242]|uniref:hypothetical protein n=1 Tax=Roseateles sp. YR242 TaxID=1855305 RepID=UPI0008D8BC10|nr:hypothetical protein [Roseateles sp. YR242]SEK35385.1 hypothetical protein SAMN05216359_101531 [Roseateles sp. YR242]